MHVPPVADQNEGGHQGDFEKQEEQQQVAGQKDSEHPHFQEEEQDEIHLHPLPDIHRSHSRQSGDHRRHRRQGHRQPVCSHAVEELQRYHSRRNGKPGHRLLELHSLDRRIKPGIHQQRQQQRGQSGQHAHRPDPPDPFSRHSQKHGHSQQGRKGE